MNDSFQRAGTDGIGGDLSPRTMLLGLLLALSMLYVNLAKDSYQDDFRAFYVASLALHDGLDPYMNHVDLSERYADAFWVRVDSRFLYPPPALFLFAPLSRLPYKWAKIGFGGLMTLTMIGILLGLQRRFPRQILVLLALFLTLPMFMNIDNGQIDILILALTLAAFYLGDSAKAGACLGVAIAIKFAPVLALLWFVANRRWRTVGWSLLVSSALALMAFVRWGGGYFAEFFRHLRDHGREAMPVLSHVFTTMRMVEARALVSADGINSYQHDICAYIQSPLHLLGPVGGVLGMLGLLAFTVWLMRSRIAKGLTAEQSFFLFLVVALFSNYLLWTMALVACFPLIVLLVDGSRRPNRTALMLIVPLMLTKQIVGSLNFTIWLIAVGFCLIEARWFTLAGSAARRDDAPLTL